MTRSLINTVAAMKNRFARSLTYVAWINTPILSLTLLNTLILLGLNVRLIVWGPIVFFGTLVALLVLGWLDERFGVLSAEQKYLWDRNLAFSELKDEIRQLKVLVEALK